MTKFQQIHILFSNFSSDILHSLSSNCFTVKSSFFTSISKSFVTYITITVTNILNNNKAILRYNEIVQSPSCCQNETV